MKPSPSSHGASYRDQDFWLSLVLLTLSSAVYVTASGYDDLPSRFPRLLAVSLAILASALLGSTIVRKVSTATPTVLSLSALRGPVVVALGMTGYLLVLPWGGYFATSLALFFFVAKALGYRSSASLAITAVVAVVALYLSFGAALGVPLPTLWMPDE